MGPPIPPKAQFRPETLRPQDRSSLVAIIPTGFAILALESGAAASTEGG